MDAGGLTLIAAVLLTYWFGQRSAEQRAQSVKDELVARIEARALQTHVEGL